MRRPHPIIILLLALLFAGQTVAAVAYECERVSELSSHDCCDEHANQARADDCGCYDVPGEPAPEPVAQVQPTPIVATLVAAIDATPEPTVRRLTSVETVDLPAAPPLRAHDVRAPPALQ
ncbi:MAG: hypothetical protein ACOX9R_04545 [Armatimonadota bacterium]|jgi:hypothetical protein